MSFDDNRSYWRQLAGDAWRAAPGAIAAYEQARMVTSEGVKEAIEDDRLPEWCETFVMRSLDAVIVRQSVRNGSIMSIATPEGDKDWPDMLDGTAWPHQLVRLKKRLGDKALNVGLEEARLTHIGIWDTEDTIDAPVRRNLVNSRALDTWLIEGQPYYKLKYSDTEGTHGNGEIHDRQHTDTQGTKSRGEIVERKRLIATHYGNPYENRERLWTMRRDILLIDFVAIREILGENSEAPTKDLSPEQLEARRLINNIQRATSNPENRDYDKRSSRLNTVLEPLIDRPIDLRPAYIKPLLTTNYLKDAGTGNVDTQLTLF